MPLVLDTNIVLDLLTPFTFLRDGALSTSGPAEDVMTRDALSECFGLALTVSRHGGRWAVAAAR